MARFGISNTAVLVNSNVLMSLPDILVNCILRDWVDVVSIMRLDIACSSDKAIHLSLLDILKSNCAHIKVVKRLDQLPCRGGPPSCSMLSHNVMLNWLNLREVKVLHLELHEQINEDLLETYLQTFGHHLLHVCLSSEVQQTLIGKYCSSITSYSIKGTLMQSNRLLRIINTHPKLETLHLVCEQRDWHQRPTEVPAPNVTLEHLKEIEWFSVYGFDEELVFLAKAAPHLQQLVLRGDPQKFCGIRDSLIIGVARACPDLRTLSCVGIDFGDHDNLLKPFFVNCGGIVTLDLRLHKSLSDFDLIPALSELKNLKSLDLRGCCTLTDRTLEFLAQRFASTLQILYLDYSRFHKPDIRLGYTAAGICTPFTTFCG